MRRRVRHIVTEDQRVQDTVELLRAGRIPEIGPLLTASHASMRDDFEITVPEVDTAVEAALSAGAYGARMTGGGFGGCVLALVDAGAADAVAAAVAEACREHGVARLAVPGDLPPAWFPAGVEVVADEALDIAELDAIGAALTGCALAIAETGTIVLDCGPRQGRRVLTLVPDVHVCVVEAAQVVDGVPVAMRRLAEGLRAAPRPLTFVSGPSATSDIELSRVEGVHGPRRLEVIAAFDSSLNES
jgi:L-lactate utilization protein LutC